MPTTKKKIVVNALTKTGIEKWIYHHIQGDLIELWKSGKWIVVPTNGEVDRAGQAIMGTGLAKAVLQLAPDLKSYLGRRLRVYGNWVHVFPNLQIITLPTKQKWKDKASLPLIETGLAELDAVVEHSHKHYGGRIDHVYVPRLGTGAGKLGWKDVEPLMVKWLGNSSRFTVVSLPHEWEELYAEKDNQGSSARRRLSDAVDIDF